MALPTSNRRTSLTLGLGALLLAGAFLGRRSLSGHAAGGEDVGCGAPVESSPKVGTVAQALEAGASPSLCSTNSCTETLELMDTAASFAENFSVVQGDHVGTHESAKYFTEQVTYADGAAQLKAVPAPAFPCKAAGNVGDVVLKNCTYKSGAVYTRNRFTVTKKADVPILHGAIEIDATIAANGDVTLEKGLWPAIWMMSNQLDDTFQHDNEPWERNKRWPSAMELDILEYMQGSSAVTGTLHYGLYTGLEVEPITSWNYVNNRDNRQIGNWNYVPGDNVQVYVSKPAERHTFGFEWKKGADSVELTWYYDGNPYYDYRFWRTAADGGFTYGRSKRIIDKTTRQWREIPDVECVKSPSFDCANAGACIQAAQEPKLCPDRYIADSAGVGDKLAYAMFKSFQDGFDAGYYLILNLAVGGDGVRTGNRQPESDITDTMTIHGVKRHILAP
jgi:beta-glucanase (GH16 family)